LSERRIAVPTPFQTTNILLNTMSQADRALLIPHFTRMHFSREFVLAPRNQPVQHVYFPEGGVVSIVSVMTASGSTEAGIFGREGVSATCLLLGSDRSPHQTFVQVNGSTALRIETDRYLAAIAQSETLRMLLLRFVQSTLVQAAQSVATNAIQRVEVRLARWLLMCHDRVRDRADPRIHGHDDLRRPQRRDSDAAHPRRRRHDRVEARARHHPRPRQTRRGGRRQLRRARARILSPDRAVRQGHGRLNQLIDIR
jgi:CRP-like cAMP-binding protein